MRFQKTINVGYILGVSLMCVACNGDARLRQLSADEILTKTWGKYHTAEFFATSADFHGSVLNYSGAIEFNRDLDLLEVRWSRGWGRQNSGLQNAIVFKDGNLAVGANSETSVGRDVVLQELQAASGRSQTLTSLIPRVLLGWSPDHERAKFRRLEDSTTSGRRCFVIESKAAGQKIYIEQSSFEIIEIVHGDFGRWRFDNRWKQ